MLSLNRRFTSLRFPWKQAVSTAGVFVGAPAAADGVAVVVVVVVAVSILSAALVVVAVVMATSGIAGDADIVAAHNYSGTE